MSLSSAQDAKNKGRTRKVLAVIRTPARKKPGPPRVLTQGQIRTAVALRRKGASVAFLATKLGVTRWTVWKYLRGFKVLGRARSPIITLLEETPVKKNRLELARLILELDELAQLPAERRTVAALERIRGVSYHRTQFARMRRWCSSVGIELAKETEPGKGEQAHVFIDSRAVRRVLTKKVLAVALAIRLEFQKQRESAEKACAT